MNTFHPHMRRIRARGAYLILAVVVAVLLVGFFRVQVLRSNTWELRAESNRIRQVPVPAPRGTVYDRNGRILADNAPGYAITLVPMPRDSARAVLARLAEHIDLSEERIERVMTSLARFGREVVVDADADFESVSVIEERRGAFPGIYVEMRPRRRYLLGEPAAHVLGYVGELTAEEMASPQYLSNGYERGMVVGKLGVEKQYEGLLQGRPGWKYLEFDARGRVVGDFGGVRTDPGEPGEDLHLNLDYELQEFVHSIFPDTLMGAVVVLDPADGGVLAMYSAPTYDPNDFVGGIDEDIWQALSQDEAKPMFNRPVLGLYAPASTWKLATAGIALDLGIVTPDEHMEDPCTGGWQFGNRYFRCWDPEGHGFNNLTEAVGNSCDVYFYQLGVRIGLNRLLTRATEIGFSQRCGIDLPQESRGVFPESRDFWQRNFNYAPTEGETLSLAIGQGPNSQTPLKMAQFYVALARDGSAPAPRLARGVDLGEGWELNLSSEDLESLRDGLRYVTSPGGTAHFGTALEHWEVLGKTGTGQNPLSVQGLAEDHAWFAGMAGRPGGPPEVVVAVLVEYGASGSRTAAPIMAKTADFYLRRKYGIPVDTIQTYLEHLQAGVPAPWYRERFPTPQRTEP
ncbi:MAG: penicillin-binding protein 2 [Gemmatimonadota bacterium]